MVKKTLIRKPDTLHRTDRRIGARFVALEFILGKLRAVMVNARFQNCGNRPLMTARYK